VQHTSNPKDTWRAAKAIITPRNDCGLQLMVGDEIIQEECRVANVMNDFFITKVEGLRQKIDPTDLPDPLGKKQHSSNTIFQLNRLSECQVLHAINKLKSKPSSGLDQINSNVLKAGREVWAVPLQFIINTSITSELDLKSQGPCRVQVQINNALRLALGVKKIDHISVEELLDRTKSSKVIQATQRLTSSIIKGDCKGLKDFFDCNLEVKRTTRSSDK
jgi:hypothetical protein